MAAVGSVPYCRQHCLFSVNEAELGMPYFLAPALWMSCGIYGRRPRLFGVFLFGFYLFFTVSVL